MEWTIPELGDSGQISMIFTFIVTLRFVFDWEHDETYKRKMEEGGINKQSQTMLSQSLNSEVGFEDEPFARANRAKHQEMQGRQHSATGAASSSSFNAAGSAVNVARTLNSAGTPAGAQNTSSWMSDMEQSQQQQQQQQMQ